MKISESERPTVTRAPSKIVYAIYDLAHCPVTYDILQFLGCCEAFRDGHDADGIHVSFVLGPAGEEFRRHTNKDLRLTDAEKMARVHRILVPCASLLQNFAGVSLFHSRTDLARFLEGIDPSRIYPLGYHPDDPKRLILTSIAVGLHNLGFPVQGLTSTASALSFIDEWIEAKGISKPIVALTFRNSSIEKERNSSTENWLRFADYLQGNGFHPVGIPDTELALSGRANALSDGLEWHHMAALDPELRAALYQRAFISMASGGGPSFINIYSSHMPCLIFMDSARLLTGAPTEEHFRRQMGFGYGEQFPWASPTQRLAWIPDSFENLCDEFQKMLPLLKQR